MESRITGHTSVCMIVGDPIKFTLSPTMHNTAYQYLGIDDQFAFVCCEVDREHTPEIAHFARVMGIRGLTCANPHNTRILEYLDEVDPIAASIGSVNTVVNQGGRLVGYNTDWVGAFTALEQVCQLGDKRIAILGTGGAARAIAFGLRERGAETAILGRTIAKATALAKAIGGTAATLAEISEVADCDVIINATPIGKGPFHDISLVPPSYLHPGHVVMDAVYLPYKTQLLVDAESIGARIVPGIEMLLHQGAAQFERHTGYRAPLDVMRASLTNAIHVRSP